jgi:UDP-2-acetamido-3-amino-2,3-dideoxy-glucuronate N-acetyltransferase
MSFIHPSSFVDEDVEIGDSTRVWHFCHICKEAKIGKGCVLGQNVYIGPRVVIGDNVHIQNNVSVYEGVTIEDGVFVGPSVVFTNISNPRCEFPNKNFQKTLVKKFATIGANATIVCPVVVGEYAFVGAGSVVTRDVEPLSLVFGFAAQKREYICKCGYKQNQCKCNETT